MSTLRAMTELGKVSFISGCYRVVVTNVVDYGGLPALLSGPRPVWPDLMIELWCGRWAAGRAQTGPQLLSACHPPLGMRGRSLTRADRTRGRRESHPHASYYKQIILPGCAVSSPPVPVPAPPHSEACIAHSGTLAVCVSTNCGSSWNVWRGPLFYQAGCLDTSAAACRLVSTTQS